MLDHMIILSGQVPGVSGCRAMGIPELRLACWGWGPGGPGAGDSPLS